jgi:uncharacterized membrane protein HdeD (DUF308 family)
VAAKYILAVLACAFVIAGCLRLARDGGRQHPQSRTWFMIGAIFAVVSAWLWFQK